MMSRIVRLIGIAFALTLAAMHPMARAQDAKSVAQQISELERQIARHEAGARAAKPDPSREMQHLLDMAKLSTLYVQADRVQEAWPLGDKMLAGLEKLFGKDHPNIVTQLEANAASLALQGRYAEAEALRKRAIAINERAFGGDSLNVATSLQGMAQLFRLQERYDEALAFATRALTLAERKLPANDPTRAIFLSQVADIHMSSKRFEAAEPLLSQALAIAERTGGADTPAGAMQLIQYLQSLGLAYHGRGRHGEASPFIDRALAISAKQFGPAHAVTGTMLMTLALKLLDQDQLEAAERLFNQALPISERNSRLQGVLADNYTGLGLVAFKRKSWRDAYSLLRRAASISIELERIAAASGSPAPRNRIAPSADVLLLTAAAAYRTGEGAPADATALRDDAFQLAQRAERSAVAGVLAQMAARVSAGDGALGRLVRERQDLAIEWQRLDKSIEQALLLPAAEAPTRDTAAMRTRMMDISKRLDVIDARVAKEHPSFGKIADPAPLSIADVQQLLQPREVLLFIAHRPNQSLVWAIGRDQVGWDLVPVGEEELSREIGALRCGFDEAAWQEAGGQTCATLTGHRHQPGAALPFDLNRAHALYKAVLGPFAAITEGAHLIIATSGPMATLPFAALVTAPPGATAASGAANLGKAAWLAKRNAVSNLPSVSSLKALRTAAQGSRAAKPYLGVANPLLTGPDATYARQAQQAKANRTCATALQGATPATVRAAARRSAVPVAQLRGGIAPVELIRALTPLPETAEEVCTVARDLAVGDVDLRLAERATETEIKQLSTKGLLSSYRIVHFATHGALAGQVAAGSEPGLVLSPPAAGTSADDGYLTASEIAGLKLDADWVILSACNTAAGGRAGAEALSGIARAFFYAQARSVLASHWEVESAATVELITAATKALRNAPEIGRAEALRRAMHGLIDSDQGAKAHPSYWAPFVLVGEGGASR